MPKILLVEDEYKIAESIKKGLVEDGYEVHIAYDGLEAKMIFQKEDFDLAVVDLNLPRLDGLSLCKLIRKTDEELPILILTAMGTMDQKLEGFEAGADDYLVKPFEFRELLARIKALLKRRGPAEEEREQVLSFAGLQLNLQTKTLTRDGIRISLTAKEYQLFEYLMRNKNIVLSRSDIAKNVWGIDFDTQTNMIDVYVNFLRRKIDKGFPTRLLHTQIGMGYILKEQEPDAD